MSVLMRSVYTHSPELYDALIRAEDCESNLSRRLEAVTSLKIDRLIDVGAGTGRLSAALGPRANMTIAIDISIAMLRRASVNLAGHNMQVASIVADATSLPVESASADVCVAGWVIGHFCDWSENWKQAVDLAIGEMERVTRPAATMIVIETLGTCVDSPSPPTRAHAEYYGLLGEKYGFASETVSTDYMFPSAEIACDTIGAFFGGAVAEEVSTRRSPRVPEWTGLWLKRAD